MGVDHPFRVSALALACAGLFVLLPELDLTVSGLFGDSNGFPLNGHAALEPIHRGIPIAAVALLVALAGGWIACALWPSARAHLRVATFLLLAFLLGPVGVVNGVLKAEVGRARPVDIATFGGDRQFSPALAQADQCEANCSFVSGHAAAAFFLCVLAIPSRRRRWLLWGLGFGAVVGASRVVAGKHFISDVVFAFFVTYVSALLLWWTMEWLRSLGSPHTRTVPDPVLLPVPGRGS